MSWSRLATLLLAFAVLGGCGFRPMYSRTAYDGKTLDELSAIQVKSLPDRQGQLLRNALVTNLSPRGEPDRPRYLLDVNLSVSEGQQALRKDDTATRATDYYSVSYVLRQSSTPLAVGSFTRMFSYDFLEQHYSNVTAVDDIRHRAATAIAEEIRNRLAAFFLKDAQDRATAAAK